MITREDLEAAKARIELLAGWTEQQHFDAVFATGERWLDVNLGSLSWKHQFMSSPSFWTWWRLQWDLRNYSICRELGLNRIDSLSCNEQIGLLELMKIKHGACFLVRPARVLMDKIRKESSTCVGSAQQPRLSDRHNKQGVNKLR